MRWDEKMRLRYWELIGALLPWWWMEGRHVPRNSECVVCLVETQECDG